MMHITIYRCPTCPRIARRAERLAAELEADLEDWATDVQVVTGNHGEFTIDADGRQVEGASDGVLRSVEDLASEVRGEAVPT